MKMFPTSLRPVAGALLFLLPAVVCSQTSSPPPQSGAVYKSQSVLRATTRLVVLDVVVADEKGQPVSDFRQEDFTVLEDGIPQKLAAFSFQRPASVTHIQRKLAPGVVTNAPQYSGVSSLNVILLDAMNTDFSSRAYAQDMLIKYLESGPTIQPTAVFALEGRLTMLHDFTTDTRALRDVLAHFKPKGPIQIPDVYSAASPFGRRGSFQASPRGRVVTFKAMRFLAQALAGYPGRKNLIWLSEGFPLNLFPEALMGEGIINTEDYTPEVEQIADELMNAQVAVYPIDAAGVTVNDRFSARTAMSSMAERTGGKTFYNRNDIEVGVRTSIDDGSTYYTLEYYPQNKKWDGKFRKIAVKLARPGVKLQYRQGYYAVEPNGAGREDPKTLATDFNKAMSLDSPVSTGVIFQAGVVLPSEKTQNRVVVNFGIDPHTLAFQQKDDGLEHASVGCTVWAYPKRGDEGRADGGILNAALKPDEFQKIMASYFPCQRSLDLKPGEYTLRLGVMDRTTNLVGTASVSITVP
jgi:VWFA-related protein